MPKEVAYIAHGCMCCQALLPIVRPKAAVRHTTRHVASLNDQFQKEVRGNSAERREGAEETT
jgi:hypothetical protein